MLVQKELQLTLRKLLWFSKKTNIIKRREIDIVGARANPIPNKGFCNVYHVKYAL